MSNKSRSWVLIGLIGLIIIGGALIISPLIAPAAPPAAPTGALTRALTPVILSTTNTAPDNVPNPDVIRVTVGNARAAQDLKQAVFVDVRSAEQYAQSHIPGALSIPLNDFEGRLSELNHDQWIITYCT